MFATEFDEGFIVMPSSPPSAPLPPPQLGDPPRVSSPGTAAIIVDKQTGEMTVLPYHGEEGTAEAYRRLRAQPPPPPALPAPRPRSRPHRRWGFRKSGDSDTSGTA
ncbi:hypothetical protein [Streptomyces sp. NPDC021020]|uniref:hypothetical protein n=1 Tax=Streptomyces sp. NPDC021020 TaxID=3365109 RepID=UPI00379CBFC0